MALPAITTDLVILLIIVIAVLYGLLLGHSKLKTFALSVYVGLVLAQTFGQSLFSQAQKHLSISQNTVTLLLFGLPLLLLELGRKERGRRRGQGGMIITLVLCILTAALVISAGLSLLDPDSLKRTLGDSSLAFEIYQFRLWWLAAVPVAVIGENFIKPRESH